MRFGIQGKLSQVRPVRRCESGWKIKSNLTSCLPDSPYCISCSAPVGTSEVSHLEKDQETVCGWNSEFRKGVLFMERISGLQGGDNTRELLEERDFTAADRSLPLAGVMVKRCFRRCFWSAVDWKWTGDFAPVFLRVSSTLRLMSPCIKCS